jgi:hypothetical protein
MAKMVKMEVKKVHASCLRDSATSAQRQSSLQLQPSPPLSQTQDD